MSIAKPAVEILQDFTTIPAAVTDPLRPYLIGPEYLLHRYSVTAEKVQSGEYDPSTGNTISWLNDLARKAGSVVDQSYTKVYIEDALLRYWASQASPQYTSSSAAYTDPDSLTVSTPDGDRNRIHVALSGSYGLVAKTDYPLHPDFQSRDVAIGDYAKIQATLDGVTYTAAGDIIGLEADAIAATVGTAAALSTNQATVGSLSTSVSPSSGYATITATSYDGLPDGAVVETYTVEVLQGSTGLDATTIIFSVTSGSGDDDVASFSPTAASLATAIPLGTRGATFVFGASVKNGSGEVITGSTFTVTINQAFKATSVTSSSGVYVGTQDTTYVLTVSRGGLSNATDAADKPLIEVTSTTGYDPSGPRLLSGTTNGAGKITFTVGNHGVTALIGSATVSTSGQSLGLRKGDKFTIDVTAEGEGAIRTIVLNTNIPDELIDDDITDIDLAVSLHIKKDLELHALSQFGGQDNWEQDADALTIAAGVTEYDSSWVSGTEPLSVVGGDVFVHWRELLSTHTSTVTSIGTLAELIEEFESQIDKDNPLVFAASKCLENLGGATLRMFAVPTDDLAGYTVALAAGEKRDDVYVLVPLTFNLAIQQAVIGHCVTMSAPEMGRWRTAMVCTEEVNPVGVVTANANATTSVVSGNNYLQLSGSSTANFITSGVRAGDSVRINYSVDKYGVATFESYTVDAVISSTRLRLTSGPDIDVSPAARCEVWRTLTDNECITAVGTIAGAFGNRRAVNIYPSVIAMGGEDVPGYFLAAAVAGLVGASVPHQGLTNVELLGIDHVHDVLHRFTPSQLDTLAGYGVWIVTQDEQTGDIFTRHELTTDVTDLNRHEYMITKNVDSISKLYRDELKPFIGRTNLTPDTIEKIRATLMGAADYLRSATVLEDLGGQLLDATITTLRAHAILKDRLVVVIKLTVPYPLNYISVTLVI